MHAEHGRQADGEMDVGAALVGAELEKGVYSGHAKGTVSMRQSTIWPAAYRVTAGRRH